KRHHFRCGRKGEARAEHRVAGADPVRHQRNEQRVSAVGASNHMLHANIFDQLLLELGNLRPENIASLIQHLAQGFFQPVLDAGALRAKVDELHATTPIHVLSSEYAPAQSLATERNVHSVACIVITGEWVAWSTGSYDFLLHF